MSTPSLVDRVLAELGDVSTSEPMAPADRELVSLRVAILLEQVFGLTLTDVELSADLTDPSVLRTLLARADRAG